MGLSKLIPGVLAAVTAVLFIGGVYFSAPSATLIKEDCNKCHEGYTPVEGAREIHAGANITTRECKECHESAIAAHADKKLKLSDCAHCHERDRGGAMAYSNCTDCHKTDPHKGVTSKECSVCHTNCNTCHKVEITKIAEGRHTTLQCNGCHIYHTYKPDCTNCHTLSETHINRTGLVSRTETCAGCHGTAHPESYGEIRKEVWRITNSKG